MKIDNTEYDLLLWFEDEEGELIYQIFFHGYEDLNRYIRENQKNPDFAGTRAQYTFVRGVHEEPGDDDGMICDIEPFEELSEDKIKSDLAQFAAYRADV